MLGCLVSGLCCPPQNKISLCFRGQTYVQLTNVQLAALTLMVALLPASGHRRICSIYQLGLSSRTAEEHFCSEGFFTTTFTPQESLGLENRKTFQRTIKTRTCVMRAAAAARAAPEVRLNHRFHQTCILSTYSSFLEPVSLQSSPPVSDNQHSHCSNWLHHLCLQVLFHG